MTVFFALFLKKLNGTPFLPQNTKIFTETRIIIEPSRNGTPLKMVHLFLVHLYYQKSKKAENRAGCKAASKGLVKHFKDLVKKGK